MAPTHRSPWKRSRDPSSSSAQQQSNEEETRLYNIRHVKKTINMLFQLLVSTPSNPQEHGAITAAVAAFVDYLDDEAMCNVAVEAGAAHALTLQLGYVLQRTEFGASMSSNVSIAAAVGIIQKILKALSIVYKCSESVRYQSFVATGEEIVPLIISTFLKSKQQVQKIESDFEHQEGAYDEKIIVYGIRVLSLLSDVELAKHQITEFRSIIEIIVKVLKEDAFDEAREDALLMLRNLSTHTAEDYKLKLVRFPQLLQSLVQIFHLSNHYNTKSSRHVRLAEYISFIVRHLSHSKLAKLYIAERGDVVNIMIKLSTDDNVRTKREAICAILGLALLIENRVLLMRQSEGAVSFALAQILRTEMDYVVRRRAARALGCMACSDTVDLLLLGQANTIEMLSTATLMDNIEEVRIESAKALTLWATVQQLIPISSYDVLLRCLVDIISSSKIISCIDSVSNAILYQAKAPQNHCPMATNTPLMSTLSTLIYQEHCSAEARENVINIFLYLSTTQADILLHQHGPRILDMLVHVLVSSLGGASDTARFSYGCQNKSIDAIIQLSSLSSSVDDRCSHREHMAKHKGLMIALLRYSAISEDPSRKAAAKKTIIKLVPYM
jgi:hypothetical protein